MVLGAEERRFLTQNWEILDLHYLKRQTVSRIAQRTGKRETYIRRVMGEAWELGITYADVADYMKHV